jgi:polysaccharide biosynthesis protein PslG
MLLKKNNISKIYGLLLGFIISFVFSIFFTNQAHAVSNFQKGTVPDLTWGISRTDVDKSVVQMKDAGVKWARLNVSWKSGEPDVKGTFNNGYLSDIDYAVDKARANGIQVIMPISDGVPYWASADPKKYTDSTGKHWDEKWRPTNFQDYADFTRTMASRYRLKGVNHFEVWNEPNHIRFWPSGVNASEYVQMLKLAYPAIKGGHPGAIVLMGGLSKNDYNYLQQMYTAGARSYFDVAAVHPYTGNVDPTWCWNQAGTTKKAIDAFCGIEEVRNTMVANGDTAKNLWLTEMGWSSCSCDYGVSETTQASFLTKAFQKLESYTYVKVALWYNFRNNYWENNNPASLEANFGLLRTNFTQKPAYASFKNYNP